jgi:AraC family transcriptional activator of pobA
MGERHRTEDLYDPRTGGQSIRTERLRLDGKPVEPARTNCFAVCFIEAGAGTVWADASQFPFGPGSLLFFVPYQHVRFVPVGPVHGEVVRFHANFLCVETFHAEVGCSGVLFNDPYGVPVVGMDGQARADVADLITRIRKEHAERDLAYGEVMLAHLKVLLVLATRLKASKAGACGPGADLRHPVLAALRDLIEQNYRTLHSPADYAKRLHVTPKTLGRIVRDHLGTTPTDLIRSRILTHASGNCSTPSSRSRRSHGRSGSPTSCTSAACSRRPRAAPPTDFREFETAIRGGSNLSMPSGHAPILKAAASSDT